MGVFLHRTGKESLCSNGKPKCVFRDREGLENTSIQAHTLRLSAERSPVGIHPSDKNDDTLAVVDQKTFSKKPPPYEPGNVGLRIDAGRFL
jgi:hypothetical protein